MDETFAQPAAPLRSAWGRKGERIEVPLTAKGPNRVVFGALNLAIGDALFMIARRWTQCEHQDFLRLVRSKWRGWRIVLFLDRGSPHTAEESLLEAQDLGIELRWLPVACPELNPVEGLWDALKGRQCLANRPEPMTAQEAAEEGVDWLCRRSPRQLLEASGALSPDFWLRDVLDALGLGRRRQ